jgi:hypothetical protein
MQKGGKAEQGKKAMPHFHTVLLTGHFMGWLFIIIAVFTVSLAPAPKSSGADDEQAGASSDSI